MVAAPPRVRRARRVRAVAIAPPPPPKPWWWGRAPWLFVAGACVFSLLTLSGELATVQPVNDETLHFEMVRWAVQQIHEGNVLPLDGWFPYLSLGDAQFSHYQSLPHLLTAYASLVFGSDSAERWAGYLLFALFPLSVYAGTRLLGWSRWTAGGAALVTPLLVSVTGYGYEFLQLHVARQRTLVTGVGDVPPAARMGLQLACDQREGTREIRAGRTGRRPHHRDAFPHRVLRAAVDRRAGDRHLARAAAANRSRRARLRWRRARGVMGGGAADHRWRLLQPEPVQPEHVLARTRGEHRRRSRGSSPASCSITADSPSSAFSSRSASPSACAASAKTHAHERCWVSWH